GPVPLEENEPLFHADWESRAMAITVLMGGWGRWNIDAARRAREDMHPAAYLNHSYYERWIDALERLMLETGMVTEEELRGGEPQRNPPEGKAPPAPEAVAAMLRRGGPSLRSLDRPARFQPGDQVRTLNTQPQGHTRLPRYARARTGTVVFHHGAHVLPDSNAHFQGENPDHLYAVRFTARELWGPKASVRDTVTLDLWENYLEPA
ncbi:MAG: nitrile hydratase subunit beta, partial [Ectothiorhodospiraceae bacterium]|nr:nitrile hydratase subunit beta [Ectothiorhodospiraceae bacterium]